MPVEFVTLLTESCLAKSCLLGQMLTTAIGLLRSVYLPTLYKIAKQ